MNRKASSRMKRKLSKLSCGILTWYTLKVEAGEGIKNVKSKQVVNFLNFAFN